MANNPPGSRSSPSRRPDAENPITYESLDQRSKDRIFQEAKAVVLAEHADELRKQARDKVSAEVRDQIIEQDMAVRMKRVLAVLMAIHPKMDRYGSFCSKELIDREPIDEIAKVYPGIAMNKRQRITVAGLIATIGYQFTCRADGAGGSYLKGVLGGRDNSVMVGFTFEKAVKESKPEYKADPANGLTARE